MTTLRRAGSPWRILVHEWLSDRQQTRRFMYGRAYDISNNPAAPRQHAETRRKLAEISPDMGPLPPDDTNHTVLDGTEFDELVIGKWIHLEQMDTGKWWMNVGGVTINITADRDGQPKRIDVYGPGDYGMPAEGCKYSLMWSAD